VRQPRNKPAIVGVLLLVGFLACTAITGKYGAGAGSLCSSIPSIF
jgi:hypothetical protein